MLVAMLLARSDEVAEMRRRDMLKAALGFTWIAVPNATVAQTRGRKRIGYLSGGSHGLRENNIDILEKHLGALGWRAGETREFEERWADGDFSRLPRLASELVMLRPDVIVATGSTETTSLHIATNEHRTSRLVLRPSGPSNSISGCRLFIPIPTWLIAGDSSKRCLEPCPWGGS
jgi:hypothetical protein